MSRDKIMQRLKDDLFDCEDRYAEILGRPLSAKEESVFFVTWLRNKFGLSHLPGTLLNGRQIYLRKQKAVGDE